MGVVEQIGGRSGKKKSLSQIYADLPADPEVVFGFDPFGDNVYTDPMADGGYL
jgi:hypothetical protein